MADDEVARTKHPVVGQPIGEGMHILLLLRFIYVLVTVHLGSVLVTVHLGSVLVTVHLGSVLVTVHLGSVLVNNQVDAQFFFRIYLFQFSMCFGHPCAHQKKNQLY